MKNKILKAVFEVIQYIGAICIGMFATVWAEYGFDWELMFGILAGIVVIVGYRICAKTIEHNEECERICEETIRNGSK